MTTNLKQEGTAAFQSWHNEYGIVEYVDFTEDGEARVSNLDEHLVWTDHGTCENNQISNGFRVYGGSGCGCWQTYGWYIATNPWVGLDSEFISIDTEGSSSCEVCNEDGEDEAINPECKECEGEGYVHYYFD
jgi:hypothetical protein